MGQRAISTGGRFVHEKLCAKLFKHAVQACLNKRIDKQIFAIDGSESVLNLSQKTCNETIMQGYENLIMTFACCDYSKFVDAPSSQIVAIESFYSSRSGACICRLTRQLGVFYACAFCGVAQKFYAFPE